MFELSREAISLGSFTVQWYGVLIALGVLLGVFSAHKRAPALGLPKDITLDLALFLVPAAVVGARAYYVAFSWDYYALHPEKIFALHEGGMAIYGSILAGILVCFVFARVRKLPVLKLFDLAAPSVALGQAIGRWGNFLNQEAFGCAVTDPKWQFFPVSVFIEAEGAWHLATFFYESFWCFLIFFFLRRMERHGKMRQNGDVFLWYAFLYALERAVVEGLRTDSLFFGPFRVSQALSLLALLAVSVAFAVREKKPLLVLLPLLMLTAFAAGAKTAACLIFAVLTLSASIFLFFRKRHAETVHAKTNTAHSK